LSLFHVLAISFSMLQTANSEPIQNTKQEDPSESAPSVEVATPPSESTEKNPTAVEDIEGEPGTNDIQGIQSEPESEPLKYRVLAPTFNSRSEHISSDELDVITALVYFHISKHPALDVISGDDLTALFDMEAEKQLYGCEEESCLEEIAGALDADFLITGHVGRMGNRIVVHLTLINAKSAQIARRAIIKARTQGELPYKLRAGVHALLQDFGGLPEGHQDETRTSFTRSVQDFASQPDMIMLLAVFGMSFAGVILPLCLGLPLMQSAILWGLGDLLAGRAYPYWWTAPLVGYPILLIGLTGFLAAYGTSQYLESNTWLRAMVSREIVFTGAAGFFAVVFILEPMAVWLFGTLGASDIKDIDEVSNQQTSLKQNFPFLLLPVTAVRALHDGAIQSIE
jgi:hypothetical protein